LCSAYRTQFSGLPPNYQQELSECLKAIKDEEDMAAAAKCISRAYDMEEIAKETVFTPSGSFGLLKQEKTESTNDNSLGQNAVRQLNTASSSSSNEINAPSFRFAEMEGKETLEENSPWVGMLRQNTADKNRSGTRRKLILPKSSLTRIQRINDMGKIALNR
jgi:hypothetical protein